MLVDSGVTVPALLHHDAANHVLVLSDLGPLPDLSKIFIELGGFTPESDYVTNDPKSNKLNAPPRYLRIGHPLERHEAESYQKIGEKLGRFFSRLHDSSTHRAILEAQGLEGQNIVPSLPEMKTVVHEHAIKPIKSQLLKFPSLLEREEADALYEAIEADFLRPTPQQEQCFVLGDCWTGSVLIDLKPGTDDVAAGVIDWEFSNTSGRGVNGDISQFLAHLELLRIAASSRGAEQASGHLSAVDAIVSGFIHKYQTNHFEEELMRSALLSHGAEIINCAFWKLWICKDPGCPSCRRKQSSEAKSQLDNSEVQCSLITRMVYRGISFLRCALAADPKEASENQMKDVMTPGLCDLFK